MCASKCIKCYMINTTPLASFVWTNNSYFISNMSFNFLNLNFDGKNMRILTNNLEPLKKQTNNRYITPLDHFGHVDIYSPKKKMYV